MSLSRVKTWAAGEVLTAADLNSEFNNILSGAASLFSPLIAALDTNGEQIILDADADSYLVEDSDDVILLRLQGADLFYWDGDVASPVNGITFVASAAGSPPYMLASGTDTDINLQLRSKGDGDVVLADDIGNVILRASDVALAANNIQVFNAAVGSTPTMTTEGADTDISMLLSAKGAGLLRVDKTLVPNVTDAAALGSATLTFSDLFLAVGAVINFDNGDVTVTHAANALAFAGGTVSFDASPTVSGNALIDAGDAASATVSGIVELATIAETNTGTDAARALTPDGLAGSNFGIAYVQIEVFNPTTNCATGNGKKYFRVPAGWNGMNLVEVHARTITAGTTGTMDIQIANATQAADMLSTKLTIDSGEIGSHTAATPAVIDAANDDVATNDLLRIDVDAVQTTPAVGLLVTLGFQLP